MQGGRWWCPQYAQPPGGGSAVVDCLVPATGAMVPTWLPAYSRRYVGTTEQNSFHKNRSRWTVLTKSFSEIAAATPKLATMARSLGVCIVVLCLAGCALADSKPVLDPNVFCFTALANPQKSVPPNIGSSVTSNGTFAMQVNLTSGEAGFVQTVERIDGLTMTHLHLVRGAKWSPNWLQRATPTGQRNHQRSCYCAADPRHGRGQQRAAHVCAPAHCAHGQPHCRSDL